MRLMIEPVTRKLLHEIAAASQWARTTAMSEYLYRLPGHGDASEDEIEAFDRLLDEMERDGIPLQPKYNPQQTLF